MVAISIDTLAKASGVETDDFDLSDKENMNNLKLLSYPLLHANMMPSTSLGINTGLYTILTWLIFPEAYADENGTPY